MSKTIASVMEERVRSSFMGRRFNRNKEKNHVIFILRLKRLITKEYIIIRHLFREIRHLIRKKIRKKSITKKNITRRIIVSKLEEAGSVYVELLKS